MMGAIWALVLGIFGFLAGFYGPLYLPDDSPQGPLLGIFGTGPLGFGAGLIIGLYLGEKTRITKFGSLLLLAGSSSLYFLIIILYVAVMS